MPGRRAFLPGRRAFLPGRRAFSPGRRAYSPGRRAFSPLFVRASTLSSGASAKEDARKREPPIPFMRTCAFLTPSGFVGGTHKVFVCANVASKNVHQRPLLIPYPCRPTPAYSQMPCILFLLLSCSPVLLFSCSGVFARGIFQYLFSLCPFLEFPHVFPPWVRYGK